MHLLNRYLPIYQFSEVHACDVAAGPAVIIDRVFAYRPETDRVVRFAIGLRELPTRLLGGQSAARPAFGLHDFTLLDRSDDAIVCGLIGRFWRPDFDPERVADSTAFHDSDAPHAAKLALAFVVRPGPGGRTRLITETRVFCASRAARLAFTPYWLLIRPVSGPIRRRVLAAIKRDSERPSSPGRVIAAHSS